MKRIRSNTLAAMLSVIMLPAMSPPLVAQTSRGTVTGVVTDPQGAVIQGANAELKNTLTNQTRTARSNDAGIYRFDALDLGIYDLKVSIPNCRLKSNREVACRRENLHQVGRS